jgi:hypothetical protein
MHCSRSFRSQDRGFEYHSGHGCLVFVCLCGFFCVCVQVETLRRADHPPKESYRLSKDLEKRTETESFMEVSQGPNWNCSTRTNIYCRTQNKNLAKLYFAKGLPAIANEWNYVI